MPDPLLFGRRAALAGLPVMRAVEHAVEALPSRPGPV